MVVYARKVGTVIWSDHRSVHKAGRVPLHEPLRVISENVGGWYAIYRPDNLSLPPDANYSDYWVKRSDTIDEIDSPELPELPEIPAGKVSDERAAQAILTLLKWWKDY